MKQIIKYAAVAFALCLATSIIGGCVIGVINVIGLATDIGSEYSTAEETDFFGIKISGMQDVKSGTEQFTAGNVKNLDIDCGNGAMTIEAWDEDSIYVEYENLPEYYEIGVEDDTFYIRRESGIWFWGWFNFSMPAKAVIKVPNDIYEKIEIDRGAGSMTVKYLCTKKIEVDSGSGALELREIVAEKSEIDMGSGTLNASMSTLGNLDIDMGSGVCTLEDVVAEHMDVDSGSGRISYSGKLTGNCTLECGSGSVTLDIYGLEEDYNIRSDVGSGGLYVNGTKVKREEVTYRNAENLLVLETGSGRISVNFMEETE